MHMVALPPVQAEHGEEQGWHVPSVSIYESAWQEVQAAELTDEQVAHLLAKVQGLHQLLAVR